MFLLSPKAYKRPQSEITQRKISQWQNAIPMSPQPVCLHCGTVYDVLLPSESALTREQIEEQLWAASGSCGEHLEIIEWGSAGMVLIEAK